MIKLDKLTTTNTLNKILAIQNIVSLSMTFGIGYQKQNMWTIYQQYMWKNLGTTHYMDKLSK